MREKKTQQESIATAAKKKQKIQTKRNHLFTHIIARCNWTKSKRIKTSMLHGLRWKYIAYITVCAGFGLCAGELQQSVTKEMPIVHVCEPFMLCCSSTFAAHLALALFLHYQIHSL